jgi:hypothetical protein
MSSHGQASGIRWAAFLASACLFLAGLAGAQELELKRVILSAGGVGYFEYEAQVEGDATLPLSVRLGQVDDVLKSIVVYDDKGEAGAIRLAGREPLSQVFRDLPFSQAALQSPVELLNALAGAEVSVTGQRQIEGRLVRAVPEKTSLPNGGGVLTRHRVSVMTSSGLQTFLFEEAESVVFTDTLLKAQIETALAAISEYRARDRRTLKVDSRGKGRRTVRVGYVVASPLWKATYRLTMDEGTPNKSRLQGWAVIENMSGGDWDDIELTIVSGNPVAFRQALYSVYYAHRPEVPVEILGRVLPKVDTGTVAIDEVKREDAEYEDAFRTRQRADIGSDILNKQGVVAEGNQLFVRGGRSGEMKMDLDTPAPVSPTRLVAATSKEAATQVSFRVPQAISVKSGQSVLVPLIDRNVPSRRVGIYQDFVHDRNPLSAVRLDNDGETGLPAGVITLYEIGAEGSTFVGDAQLSTLPMGEERFVSFALDQKTTIDREVETEQSIVEGRIADGTLELTYEEEQTTVYRIKAPTNEKRDLIIEHPRRQGWKIVEPDPEKIELTDSRYRIPLEVGEGKQVNLKVSMTKSRLETVMLTDQVEDYYLTFARNGELNSDLREALEEMARLRAAVASSEELLQQKEHERQVIHEEQARIRDNLYRVSGASDLQARYLAKLNAQEDLLEKILPEIEDARAQIAAAKRELADYIRDLEI